MGADLGLLVQLLLQGVPAGHSLPMLRVEGLQRSKARRIIREQDAASPGGRFTACTCSQACGHHTRPNQRNPSSLNEQMNAS